MAPPDFSKKTKRLLAERAGQRCSAPFCDRLTSGTGKPTSPPPPPKKEGVFQGEAQLSTGEIQDLADAIPDLSKATAGYDLKFHLSIELGWEGDAPASKATSWRWNGHWRIPALTGANGNSRKYQ